MGSHDPFWHLKHKLWPKEGPGVKLVVWLLTTKSRESTQFPFLQVTCNIPLESFQQGLQIYFRSHLNQRSAHKIMVASQLWQIWDSHLGVLGQKAIWMWVSWRSIEYTIRGKLVASPKSGPWWVLWIRLYPWLILAPKVLQLCTNHLVLVLCRSVWVVDACHSS
jgi:hypothetical protein